MRERLAYYEIHNRERFYYGLRIAVSTRYSGDQPLAKTRDRINVQPSSKKPGDGEKGLVYGEAKVVEIGYRRGGSSHGAKVDRRTLTAMVIQYGISTDTSESPPTGIVR